jgi:hypothetical protein
VFLHFARSCSPLPSSNLQVSRTQGTFLNYEKNMNIMTKKQFCALHKQGYEIEFALPN